LKKLVHTFVNGAEIKFKHLKSPPFGPLLSTHKQLRGYTRSYNTQITYVTISRIWQYNL